ncbi:TPA: TM2 domain-containing protein [Candidatus Woesearchaeota archaeon]|nr:TM2 domain-containing protein [Candidatus Woesearchaeota archaeon]HIH92464.1 TM2 domain-containing protein [Candidatus Woesearchaeota archaeon]HII64220.1 TM2 domain-containing protein [Candidatus Woesearchaeota archaeon]
MAPKKPGAGTSKGPEKRKFIIALLLSIFVGAFGVDRFYMGLIGTGILKLITLGGCGVWWLIDLILIATNQLRDADGNYLEKDTVTV